MGEQQKFLRVDEVAEILRCSKSHAYKVMQGLNEELRRKGKITIAGRISRKYFEERVFG